MGNQTNSDSPNHLFKAGYRMPKPYHGSFERVVDKSGRVLLPNEWREVGETDFLCLVWPLIGEPEYIRVLPPRQAEKLYEKLGDLPLSDEEGNALNRAVASHAYDAKLDGVGRLPIPEGAMKAAGIEGRIKLVGGFTRFELWNPDRYAASEARPEFVAKVTQGLASLKI